MKQAQFALFCGSLVFTVLGAACGETTPQSAAPDAGTDAPIEPPPEGCAPGRVELAGGACVNAGVPPEACGEGFQSDGKDGCAAITPEERCPKGLMAIPGETTCREVAPCGDGDYGAIPVDASTHFVNQAYAGGGSDGSKDKPWTTVGEALNAAPAGAIVAVAAGTYSGDLTITKPVRLWGRCPSLVAIHGTGQSAGLSAINVEGGASGAELRDIAITSLQRGVGLFGATGVVLDRVWLHDLNRQGIYLVDINGASSVTVARSLLEGAVRTGIYAGGSAVTLEESVVRDTLAGMGTGGKGIYVESTSKDPPVPTGSAKLTIRRSLLEMNHTISVHLRGGEGLVESTLIRDTQEEPGTGTFGVGLYIDRDPSTGEDAKATVRTSIIERSVDAGVFIHAAAVGIEDVVVRDVASQSSDNRGGRGVNIDYEGELPSKVTIQRSLIERSRGAGLFVAASEVTMEATVVRDTDTEPDGRFGFGVTAQADFAAQDPAIVVIRSCLIERSHVAGIMSIGTETTVEHTLVTDTLTAGDGSYGDGLALLNFGALRGVGSVTGSRIVKSARAGISNFTSDMTIKDTLLDCNPIHLDGEGEAFTFDDAGNNVCRCAEETTPCKVLSSNLEPPEAF